MGDGLRPEEWLSGSQSNPLCQLKHLFRTARCQDGSLAAGFRVRFGTQSLCRRSLWKLFHQPPEQGGAGEIHQEWH